MVYGLYAIRDVKTGFMSPVLEPNSDSAVRNFVHSIGVSDGILHSFAHDFSLHQLGTFDSDSGLITPLSVPAFVYDGSQAFRDFSSDS